MEREKVVIVVRTGTGWPVARGPILAKGQEPDPPGKFYLRFYLGNKKYRYQGAFLTYIDALRAKKEEEERTHLEPLMRTGEITLTAFIAHLSNPSTKKKDGRTYRPKSIREREADIREFLAFSKKLRILDIKREDVLRWRDSLNLHPHTVRGKLSSVSSWLRHAGTNGLLVKGDLPGKRKTRPKPYSGAEIDAQLKVATGHDHLLLRVALSAGLRKMELATLELTDIHETLPIITVQEAKPQFGWAAKTVQGARDITIDKGLWEDLLALPEGLLFPAPNGGVDVHIDRRFQDIGKRAKIKRPAGNGVGWCHRWRHSCATERIRNGEDPVTVLAQMGWSDFEMIKTYAESDPENPLVLAAAERRARPGKKKRPSLVKTA